MKTPFAIHPESGIRSVRIIYYDWFSCPEYFTHMPVHGGSFSLCLFLLSKTRAYNHFQLILLFVPQVKAAVFTGKFRFENLPYKFNQFLYRLNHAEAVKVASQ